MKICFNSTLVRLKAAATLKKLLAKDCFNSTLVRLKGSQCLLAGRPWCLFQFHTGSIKRWSFAFLVCLHFGKFQFHTGSIKRSAAKRGNYTLTCFNSTLVRLKVSVLLPVALPLRSFNSTLVRLKGTETNYGQNLGKPFQFHNGSIKSSKIPVSPVKDP